MSELQRCKGTNCGCTDGVSHSAECRAEHDALCYQAEIGDLRADLARLTAERDDARTLFCMNHPLVVSGDNEARDVARRHGWDCFEEVK
jgi:hypothetical protein